MNAVCQEAVTSDLRRANVNHMAYSRLTGMYSTAIEYKSIHLESDATDEGSRNG